LVRRAKDWLDQALRDLNHAKSDLNGEYYEWACFSAQQAAEKAVKALYQAVGIDAWGHSVWILLDNLPEDLKPSEELIDEAREIDRFYIPTRYPNAHAAGPPYVYYMKRDAERAIEIASKIIKYCEDKIKEIESK